MVSTAFKATFQTDEQAQIAISSFKSDLINYLRNTTQLDFTHSSLPATTRLPSDTPAKPNAKYFKNIKDQMLRQYHMFFGTKALFQSIVGHENAYKITNEIYKVVGQQHFFSGYAVQQFYEEDEIEMQSITCDTIDFTPKQNKKKNKKKKIKTPEQLADEKKIAKAADKTMKLFRDKRAAYQVNNDLDPVRMQAEVEIISMPSTSKETLIKYQEVAKVLQFMQPEKVAEEVAKDQAEASLWQRVLNFVQSMISAPKRIAATLAKQATSLKTLVEDIWNFCKRFMQSTYDILEKTSKFMASLEMVKVYLVSAIIFLIAHKCGYTNIGAIAACFYLGYTGMSTAQLDESFAAAATSEEEVETQDGEKYNTPIVVIELLTMAALTLFGFKHLIETKESYTTLMKDLASKAVSMAVTTSIASSIKTAFSTIAQYIATNLLGFAPDMSNFVPDDVEFFLNETLFFLDFEVRQFRTDVEACNRIKALYLSVPVLLKKYNQVAKTKTLVTNHTSFVYNVYKSASLLNPIIVTPRNEPVTICLRGAPGIGKTKMVNKLATLGMLEAGVINSRTKKDEIPSIINSQVFVRKAINEYWDGYCGQAVTVYDDFGQLMDTTSNPNPEYHEIIHLGNSFQMPLHMATLQEKGNVFFSSKMLILTTNARNFQPPSLADSIALKRRIDFPLFVTLKDPMHYSDFAKTVGILPNAHWFQFYDIETSTINEKKYEFDEIVKLIQEKFALVRDKNVAEMSDAVDFAWQLIGKGEKPIMESDELEDTDTEDPQEEFKNAQDEELDPLIAKKLQLEKDLKAVNDQMKQTVDTLPEEPYMVLYNIPSWVQKIIYPFKTVAEYMMDLVRKGRLSLVDLYRKFHHVKDWCYESFGNLVARSKTKYERIKDWTGKLKTNLIATITERYQQFKELVCKYKIPLIISSLGLVVAFFRIDKYLWNALKKLYRRYAPDIMKKTIGNIVGTTSALARPVVSTIVGTTSAFARPIAETAKNACDKTIVAMRKFIAAGYTFADYMKHGLLRMFGLEEVVEKPYWHNDWINFYWANHELALTQLALTNEMLLEDPEAQNEVVSYIWQMFESRITMQSGKSRTPTKKIARPSRVNKYSEGIVMESWNNDNSQQIALKVLNNTRLLKVGTDKPKTYNLFMIKGHQFVTNRHIKAVIDHLGVSEVEICNNGCKQGTTIAYHNITWQELPEEMDLIIGYLPPQYFPQCRDLTPHLIKKDESDLLFGKTAVLLVPSHENAVLKSGIVHDCQMREMRNPFGEMQYAKAIEVRTPTSRGDCGGVYVLDATNTRRIFGIHTAGSPSSARAFATMIYAELFDDINMQATDMEEMKVHPLQLGNGNVSILGNLKPAFNPVKSQIVKTQMHGQVIETNVAPAALDRFDVPDGPMLRALEKQFGPVKAINHDILTIAKENYAEKLAESVPRSMGVLSFEKATQGSEFSEFYKGINRQRSAGYPYCLSTTKKGKTEWFGTDEWIFNEKTAELKEKIEQQIAEMEQGKIQEYIFMDTLKDETRDISKVLAKKTRVFAAAPMDFIIVFRMYYLDFLVFMMENRIFNECAVGIKAQSNEWTILRNKLKEQGSRIVAGDFSNYDGTLHPAILWSIYDIIEDYYERFGTTTAESNVRKCLWNNIVNSYHVCGNWFYQLNHSQPSGNPSTAILNSMYNSIACRYTFYTIYDPQTNFNSFVSMIAYGDDNVLNISTQVPDFNQESMAESFSKIGMIYTDEMKTGVLADKQLEQVAFLKRGFDFDFKNHFCFSPLALSSILEALNWIKKTDAEPLIMQQIAENAIVELAMHPKTTFQLYSRKIWQAFLKTYNINLNILPYERYRMKIITGVIYDQYPALNWA